MAGGWKLWVCSYRNVFVIAHIVNDPLVISTFSGLHFLLLNNFDGTTKGREQDCALEGTSTWIGIQIIPSMVLIS